MLEERALVVAVDEQSVWVETQRQSVCGQCAANKGCGNSVLQKVLGKKRNVLRVMGDLSVDVGDEVIIGVNEDALVKGSLIVYAMPILFMIVFAMLGETIVSHWLSISKDLASIAGAFLGLMVSIIGLRWYGSRISDNANYQPVLLRHASSVAFHSEYKLLG